ncbi:MAG: hypothetical protein HPY69_18550 [Armatimonadetes bacterium]|nr:hypothetical protein [Armatimonadota bacterium]
MKPRPQEGRPRHGIPGKAFLLGLLLIPLNVYWVVTAELRWYMILTLNPLFVTPLFFLVLLVGLNVLLGRLRPSWRFTMAELLTVYIMLAVSCTVATLDYVVNWIRMIGWGAWFASDENKWEQVVFPHVPRWTLMWDRDVLRGFFEGGTLYRGDVLAAWAGPVAVWLLFMLLCCGLFLCLTVMVRRAWIEETKLSFPTVRLPLSVLGLDAPGFWLSRAMWAGAGLTLINGTLNGLAQLYPSLPHLPTAAHPLNFVTPPWNAIGWTPVSVYPFAIGLAYFVPLDVLFSCWFFYLFQKAQAIGGTAAGLHKVPGFPFGPEQAIGGWLAYAGLLLYLTRAHWARLWQALSGAERGGEGDEFLPRRTAAVAGLAMLALLLAFWRLVGMSFAGAAVALVVYLLVSLAIARVRAEAGAPHDVVSPEPMNLFRLVSSSLVTKGDVVGAGLSHWFWRFNRSHPMPTQLEALRLWHQTGLSPRRLAGPLIAATVLSCVVALWAVLHVAYAEGALAKCMGFKPLTGQEMWGYMALALTEPHGMDWPRLLAVGTGAAMVGLLWSAQARYTWFILYPLGYCVGPSLNWVWFPFLVAWIIKAAIVRYGGQRVYRNAAPFFLGLVLGDYLVGAAWAIIGPVMGFQGYGIFH